MYTPNSRAQKYMKKILTKLKEEMYSSTTGDVNTLLSIIEHLDRQSIRK